MSLACTVHGRLDLRLQEDTPRALGPNDVLVGLGAGGICGSDLHCCKQVRVSAVVIREPLAPGHEASGVVQAIGSADTRVRRGDRVAVTPSTPAGVTTTAAAAAATRAARCSSWAASASSRTPRAFSANAS